MPNALKKAFDVYDAKLQAKQRGEDVGNFEIGICAKLVYNERAKVDEVPSEPNRRRTISILVSRHISNVKRMIDNAGKAVAYHIIETFKKPFNNFRCYRNI